MPTAVHSTIWLRLGISSRIRPITRHAIEEKVKLILISRAVRTKGLLGIFIKGPPLLYP